MEIIPKKDIIHYKLILKADYRPYDWFYMKCVIPWRGLAANNNYNFIIFHTDVGLNRRSEPIFPKLANCAPSSVLPDIISILLPVMIVISSK